LAQQSSNYKTEEAFVKGPTRQEVLRFIEDQVRPSFKRFEARNKKAVNHAIEMIVKEFDTYANGSDAFAKDMTK